MFIEFLYKHYKDSILRWKLPRYILQLITYFASVLLHTDGSQTERNWKMAADFANIFSIVDTSIMIVRNAAGTGRQIFTRPWVWFDIGYIIMNGFICISNL